MNSNMNTISKKIKKFRKIKNMSQDELAQLSGINVSTIKKYECGLRNPKPEQLLKIANALGISINTFFSHEINTISDVITLLMKLDEQTNMNITGDKDASGRYIPTSIHLSFDDTEINNALSVYLSYKAYMKTNSTPNDFTVRTDTIDLDIETQLNQVITSGTIIKRPGSN